MAYAQGKPLPGLERAIFSGGCFWCMGPPFDELPGVVSTPSGYIVGHTKNPTYRQVSSGTTRHTEALQIVFDPQKVSYDELLGCFGATSTPPSRLRSSVITARNRSGIFYLNREQRRAAVASLEWLEHQILRRADRHRDHSRYGLLCRGEPPPGRLQGTLRALQVLTPELRARQPAGSAAGQGRPLIQRRTG